MKIFGHATFFIVSLCLAIGNSSAQDEMQMMDDVVRLQQQLRSSNVEERDSAEKELLEIGEFALDHLELVEPNDPNDYRTRVGRVRKALETMAVKKVTQPTILTLDSTDLSVGDLLEKIKEQTGNEVILGDQVPLAKNDLQLTLDKKELNFWDAVEQLSQQAKLTLDPYKGELGQLALADIPVLKGPDGQPDPNAEPLEVFANNSSVLRFELTRVDASRNLRRPNLNYSSFSMSLSWEPRLRPIAVELPISSIEIVDEFDRTYEFTENEGALTNIVQPSIPQLDFTVRTPVFDRQIEELKSVKGVVEAILPGRIETFKFKKVQEGLTQTKAGATVTINGVEKLEDELWSLTLTLGFDEANNALESYLSWVDENEVYLLDKDEKRQNAIGIESSMQGNGQEVTVSYLFPFDPVDCALRYKTPAAIVKVKVPFVFKGIPLP